MSNEQLNNYREQLEARAAALLSIIDIAFKTDHAGPLYFSETDRAEIRQAVEGVKFVVGSAMNYASECARFGAVAGNNMLLAIHEKETTDAEKVGMLNTLVVNMLQAMPDEWKEYYNLRAKSIFSNDKTKIQNPIICPLFYLACVGFSFLQ